jgi:hypothetical protein
VQQRVGASAERERGRRVCRKESQRYFRGTESEVKGKGKKVSKKKRWG